jgi:hypothetical protein
MRSPARPADDRRAARPRGGAWAALALLVAVVVVIVGAWRLGVMAGDEAQWRHGLPDLLQLAPTTPKPQPPPLPTQRRPQITVAAAAR